jgi:hypothetical protein
LGRPKGLLPAIASWRTLPFAPTLTQKALDKCPAK